MKKIVSKAVFINTASLSLCFAVTAAATPALPDLADLNIHTFIPTTNPWGKEQTIHEICTNIQKGQELRNHETHLLINDQAYNLICEIPTDMEGSIYIYVPGYAGPFINNRYGSRGAGANSARHFLATVLKGQICISFEGPINERAIFNFGQYFDQYCLALLIQKIIEKNPKAEIRLVGSSRGASLILAFLANPAYRHLTKHVSHAIAESPSSSLERTARHIAGRLIPRCVHGFIPFLLKHLFPNHNCNEPDLTQKIASIRKKTRILIGLITDDTIASPDDTRAIAQVLKESSKRISLVEHVNKPGETPLRHGHLSRSTPFQEAVARFLSDSAV